VHGFRDATQRTAPQLPICGLAEQYNAVLIACGTPARRRWLPQALALTTFFRDVFVERKKLPVCCVA